MGWGCEKDPDGITRGEKHDQNIRCEKFSDGILKRQKKGKSFATQTASAVVLSF